MGRLDRELTAQAREEAHVLSTFSTLSGLWSSTDFVPATALAIPGPDFVSRDGALGIELVSYHRDATSGRQGSRQRIREAGLDRMLLRAKAKFEATGAAPLDVFVFPNRRHDTGVPRLAANHLFELLRSFPPIPTTIERPPTLESIIDALTIAPTSPYHAVPLWQVVSADWTDVNCSAVQAILDDKEQRLPTYRSHAQHIGLLIHGSPGVYVGSPGHLEHEGRWSTCGHVTEELTHTLFRSSFDYVYYLDGDRHQWALLRAEP